jgi:hypothetical protein
MASYKCHLVFFYRGNEYQCHRKGDVRTALNIESLHNSTNQRLEDCNAFLPQPSQEQHNRETHKMFLTNFSRKMNSSQSLLSSIDCRNQSKYSKVLNLYVQFYFYADIKLH